MTESCTRLLSVVNHPKRAGIKQLSRCRASGRIRGLACPLSTRTHDGMPLIMTLAHVPLDSHLFDQPSGVFGEIFLTVWDVSDFPPCSAHGSTRAPRLFTQETYPFLKNYCKVWQHPGERERKINSFGGLKPLVLYRWKQMRGLFLVSNYCLCLQMPMRSYLKCTGAPPEPTRAASFSADVTHTYTQSNLTTSSKKGTAATDRAACLV